MRAECVMCEWVCFVCVCLFHSLRYSYLREHWKALQRKTQDFPLERFFLCGKSCIVEQHLNHTNPHRAQGSGCHKANALEKTGFFSFCSFLFYIYKQFIIVILITDFGTVELMQVDPGGIFLSLSFLNAKHSVRINIILECAFATCESMRDVGWLNIVLLWMNYFGFWHTRQIISLYRVFSPQTAHKSPTIWWGRNASSSHPRTYIVVVAGTPKFISVHLSI